MVSQVEPVARNAIVLILALPKLSLVTPAVLFGTSLLLRGAFACRLPSVGRRAEPGTTATT